MKDYIIKLITKVERFKKERPRLYKLLYILLWCAAPIEMGCYKAGKYGYTKCKEYI